MSAGDPRETEEAATKRVPPPEQSGRPALVRRRWTIFTSARSGVVILATAGALALGTPGEPGDDGSPAGGAGAGSELAVDDDAQS
jgi:hypothetical protein